MAPTEKLELTLNCFQLGSKLTTNDDLTLGLWSYSVAALS